MNPSPTSEILVLLLLVVFLFIFFPSVFESKRSRGTELKGKAYTRSEESPRKKPKVDVESFLELEDIEKEAHKEKRLEKATPHACNPILVLANIES